jgi:hypothetical protein
VLPIVRATAAFVAAATFVVGVMLLITGICAGVCVCARVFIVVIFIVHLKQTSFRKLFPNVVIIFTPMKFYTYFFNFSFWAMGGIMKE